MRARCIIQVVMFVPHRALGFAVDASVIEADASRFQMVEGAEIDWTPKQRARRPVREYLAALAQLAAGCGLSQRLDRNVSELRAGIWPAPLQMPRPRRKVWDIKALDAAVDRLSGFSSGTLLEEVGTSQDPGYFKRRLEEVYGDEEQSSRKRKGRRS